MAGKPLLDNAKAKAAIPWEPVGQVQVDELPDTAPEGYPAPWTTHWRGNGHVDVFAANGEQVAHVHLWHKGDDKKLEAKLEVVNNGG